MKKVLTFLFCLGSLLTLSLPSASLAAQPGVVLGGGFLNSAPTMAAVQKLKPPWIRTFMPWASIETSRGQYSSYVLGAFDQTFAQLPVGTKLIIDVTGSPSWETGSSDPNHPPANPADYARFMHFIAGRFAGKVAAWEIWNEEDASQFWSGSPVDAAAYTRLLQATYPAIKSADPNATVLLGGLTGEDYPFLQQVYAAGGRGYFDAVAVHTDTICDVVSPYSFIRNPFNNGPVSQWSFLGYQTVYQIMTANGDGNKSIWMTELGWSTDTRTCTGGAWAGTKAEGVPAATQATFLSQAYHCVALAPYIPVAIWFALTDTPALDHYYGLMDANFNAKPAFGALRQEITSGDQLTGGCGNFTGPAIKIKGPLPNHFYSPTLPLQIRVTASSSYNVSNIQLFYDNQLKIRGFGHPGSGPVGTLTGSINWQGWKHISVGRHIITIKAYDPQGDVSSQSVTITSRRAHKCKPHVKKC